MDDPIQWEILPNDEVVEGEEAVSADELYRDVMAGFAELQAYHEGKQALRITEIDDQGNRRVFHETGPETRARQAQERAEFLSYDPSVDAMYLKIRQAKVENTVEIRPGVMVAYDEQGEVIGVEVLDVSEYLPIKRAKETEAA